MHCSRVDAFRHRAAPIIADHGRGEPRLALVNPNRRGGRIEQRQKACRATKVIRHGLCPILTCAREAVNPPAASFATISASL